MEVRNSVAGDQIEVKVTFDYCIKFGNLIFEALGLTQVKSDVCFD